MGGSRARSKALYGIVMLIVAPLSAALPIARVMLGLFSRFVCRVSLLMLYRKLLGVKLRPKAFAMAVQLSSGNHISGTVESITARIPPLTSNDCSLPALPLPVKVICWTPTWSSPGRSGPKVKVKSFGMNLEVSYPPSTKLPSVLSGTLG